MDGASTIFIEFMLAQIDKILDDISVKMSEENFRRNYLRPAIELGLIQMTIPEKPSSRNQRYVKR